jgi:hypothetical protein
MRVLPIKKVEAEPWLLYKHYAKRIPSISYAFGLYDENLLIGVVTYGTPSSSALRNGVAGKELSNLVLELNRLCIDSDKKNCASLLISKSLKLLPKPSIVVSYADIEQNHVGYVYQACNFIYTGLSAKRTDYAVKGMEHLHGQTIVRLSRNCEGPRVEFMRKKFGDDFYLKERSRKHRYIFVCAKNPQKKFLESKILYKKENYPKGETKKYNADYKVKTQELLF